VVHVIRRSSFTVCLVGQLAFCGCLAFAQTLQPSAIQQIQTILQEKLARTPTQRKLDSHLHLAGELARGAVAYY